MLLKNWSIDLLSLRECIAAHQHVGTQKRREISGQAHPGSSATSDEVEARTFVSVPELYAYV